MSRRAFGILWFAATFLLCLALRLPTLGALSLWLDEVTTANVAQMGWPALVADRFANGHFPLYFGLIKGLGLGGAGEFALRLPSAIFDGLAGAIVARLAFELDGRFAAVIAALFYALMPNLIQYGQEARPYAMMLFFVALAMLMQQRLLLPGRALQRDGWIATAGTIGAVFSIPAAIVTVATQHFGLWLAPYTALPSPCRAAIRRHVLASWIAIIVGLGLLVPAVRQQAASTAGLMKWQANFPFGQRAAEAFGETFGFVIPHDADRFLPQAANGWLAGGLLLLMAAGFLAGWRRAAIRSLALTVIGTPLLYGLLALMSASAGRYMIGMMPAAVLLAALGARYLLAVPRWRLGFGALLALFLAGLFLQALDAIVSPRKYDWRPVAAFFDRIDGPVSVFSDVPQSPSVVGHYLAQPARVAFETVTPGLQPVETLWRDAANLPLAFLLLPAGERPPADLTAGKLQCRWAFGEMAVTVVARDAAQLPPALRGCGAV